MPVEVPFLADSEIEAAAKRLLTDYAHAKAPVGEPPVPIERILGFLGLRQEMHDLYSLLNIERDHDSELLGAICFNSKRVLVHEAIDPEKRSWLEGRYNFTLAHEVGHWVLHRRFFPDNSEQLSFLDNAVKPAIVCRKREDKHPIEIQANKFAAGLLMPAALLAKAWKRRVEQGGNLSSALRDEAIKATAKQFQCSLEATRYRLAALDLLGAGKSSDLAL